jgi:hypothetical protein
MITSIEKCSDLIGNRTHDLPACSIVPQPTTLPRAPLYFTWILSNSTPRLLSSIDCTDVDLGFQISLQEQYIYIERERERIQVKWADRSGNGSFISATNPVSRIIFRPLTHFATAMLKEHRHVVATCEDTYWRTPVSVVYWNVFKENYGNRRH